MSKSIRRYHYSYCDDHMDENKPTRLVFIGTHEDFNDYVRTIRDLWGGDASTITVDKPTLQEVDTYLTMGAYLRYPSPSDP